MITPSFHFEILRGFVETFSEQADVLVTNLRKEADTGKCTRPRKRGRAAAGAGRGVGKGTSMGWWMHGGLGRGHALGFLAMSPCGRRAREAWNESGLRDAWRWRSRARWGVLGALTVA